MHDCLLLRRRLGLVGWIQEQEPRGEGAAPDQTPPPPVDDAPVEVGHRGGRVPKQAVLAIERQERLLHYLLSAPGIVHQQGRQPHQSAMVGKEDRRDSVVAVLPTREQGLPHCAHLVGVVNDVHVG